MFLEIDEVAIPHALVARLRAKDPEAIEAAAKELTGLTVYMHALSADPEDYDVLTLRELKELGVVEAVTIGEHGEGKCAFDEERQPMSAKTLKMKKVYPNKVCFACVLNVMPHMRTVEPGPCIADAVCDICGSGKDVMHPAEYWYPQFEGYQHYLAPRVENGSTPGNWRSSDTAPQDGSAIIAWDKAEQFAIIHWDGDCWELVVAGSYADSAHWDAEDWVWAPAPLWPESP